MSVFKKLKGTFQTAQQDFVDGLRSLTLFDGYSKSEQIQHIKSKDINLDVGADLLHEYQKVWSSIQNDTKVCSKRAEEVDALLAPMFTIWDERAELVTSLEEEVKSIPSILKTLKELHTLLESINQDFSETETSLSMLEDVCEELDLKRRMDEETKKLSQYRSLKEKEAETVKVNLARTHAKKMQNIESSKSMKLKERAEAFTSAFKDDVDYYKTHGHPEGKLVTEFPKVTSLSEIDIVDDRNELDSFLGPQNEEEEAEGGEELYIEDDYITGFTVKEDLEGPDEDEDLTASSFLPDEEDYYSNDENENNIIQQKGDFPESYLVKNEVQLPETAEEEDCNNTAGEKDLSNYMHNIEENNKTNEVIDEAKSDLDGNESEVKCG